MTTTISVLGPPDVHQPGGPSLLGPRLARLLGILVAERERHLRTEALVERVWPDVTPSSGDAALRVQMTRLRRHLGSLESIGSSPGRGYRLMIDQPTGIDLDSDRFRSMVEDADAAAASGDQAAAAERYRAALLLWRGPAFDGCDDDPEVRVVQVGLESLRRRARRSLVAGLFGSHPASQLIDLTEVHEIVAEQPGDEQLAEIVMEGLERAGQPGEALRVFRQTDAHLRGELGVGPSARLQAVADRLLSAGR